MKRVCCVLASTLLFAACGSPAPAPGESDQATAYEARPYGTLARMMQAIAFPSSNIIFDAQSVDPGAQTEPADGAAADTVTARLSSVYGGWMAVENAAVAISETANLLMIPGRMCDNGKPAPVDQDDYRRFSEQLAQAGQDALKAAQSKDLDAIVDVSGTLTEACAACHEVYRDTEDPADRCTVRAAN